MAELARLSLDARELAALTDQLNAILEHMEALDAAPVDGPPSTEEVGEAAPLRSDEAAGDPLAVAPVGIAPSWDGGFFTVPRLALRDGLEGSEGEAGDTRGERG